MYETDLPCTECGASLVERRISSADHPLGSTEMEEIAVAVCTDCGVRHYPDATLTALGRRPDAAGGQRGVDT